MLAPQCKVRAFRGLPSSFGGGGGPPGGGAHHSANDPTSRRDATQGLKGIVMASVMTHNMVYGPWAGGERWGQITGAWGEFMAFTDDKAPWTDDLFKHFLPGLLEDRGRAGRAHEPGIEQKVWKHMVESAGWSRKGYKVSATRWFNYNDAEVARDKVYHERLLCQVFGGLHMGWLKKGGDASDIARKVSINSGSAAGPVSKGSSVSDQLISSCKNIMHAATALMLEPDFRTANRIVTTMTAPYREWHGWQAKNVRSPAEGADFWKKTSSGKCLESVSEVLNILGDACKLEHMGVVCFLPKAQLRNMGHDHPRVLDQDAIADKIFSFATALVRQRLRGMAWLLFGWPGLTARMVDGTDAEVAGCLGQLRVDLEAFEAAQRFGGGKMLKDMVKRSPFHQPLMKLLVAYASHGEFLRAPQPLKTLVSHMWAGVGSSLICEHAIGANREAESRDQQKTVVADRMWARLKQKELLSKLHRYEEVVPSRMGGVRPSSHSEVGVAKLTKPVLGEVSLSKIADVASNKQTSSWATFSPTSWCASVADLVILREAASTGDYGRCETAWLSGMLFAGTIFRKVGSVEWRMSLGEVGMQAVLSIPVFDDFSFQLPLKMDMLRMDAISDEAEWEVQPTKCVSPLRALLKVG